MRSVQACEAQAWSMLSFQSQGEERAAGDVHASGFYCGSWRCRRCAWRCAREDYRRIEKGVLSRSWWVYAVLTFDPSQWASPWDAYRGGARLWDKRLRRRLERRYGKLAYVQTWERTLRGWPHLNLLLAGDALEADVRSQPEEWRWTPTGNHGAGRWAHWTRWRRWLNRAAVGGEPLKTKPGRRGGAGFGKRVWVEIVDSREAVAAYLVKVAHEISAAAFKTGDQRPLGAPRHFRRIRASRGLLPERKRVVTLERVNEETGEVTRELRERPLDAKSDWTAILAQLPLTHWESRPPRWTDVANAREVAYNAAKKKLGRPIAPPRFE